MCAYGGEVGVCLWGRGRCVLRDGLAPYLQLNIS